jgi:hypothetical protein
MDSAEHDNRDRRSFYRLTDEIIFDYCLLEQGQEVAALEKDEPTQLIREITRRLKEVDIASQLSLQQVSQRHPQLTEHLRLLNKKIDTISEFLTYDILAKFLLKADERPTEYINISIGGLAFFHATAIEIGQQLRFKLILKPNYECILTTGEVVGCVNLRHSDTNRHYRVSVKFTDLSLKDEQVLSRYIFQRELSLSKSKTEPPD